MSDACEKLLLVQAEFDGELDAAGALEALQHRAGCAECRAAYEAIAATHARIRAAQPRFTAPPELAAAIRSMLAPAPATVVPLQQPRRLKARWRESASFVVGAALAAGIALFVLTPSQPGLLDDVVASHIRALQPGHLEDVVSTGQHTVKPWFDGRIDFAPPVEDFAQNDFPLLGGRLDYLDKRPVAALVYGREKHLIDLYVWPESGGDLAPSLALRDGYNIVHWRAHGMAFWAVSDLEASQLQNFAQLWTKAG